jgi:virginiamycin B lyase
VILALKMRAALPLAALTLAACHGASTGLPPAAESFAAATGAQPNAGRPTIVVNLAVPAAKAVLWRGASTGRNPYFTAVGTKGVKIVAYAHGSRAKPLASATASVANGSTACTKDTFRTCSISIGLRAAGKDDLVITAYDSAPSHGRIPAGAKVLGAGVAVAKVPATGSKTIEATLGGVVARTAIFLQQSTLHAIDPFTQQAVVVASDADGNAIVTDRYADANGNAVKIALAADASAGTSVTFSPKTLAQPPATGQITVTYAPPGVTGAQIQAGFFTLLSATASNGAIASAAKLSVLAPQIVEFPTPTASSLPAFMTVGSDNAIWFLETSANQIARIPTDATGGSQIAEFAVPTAASRPDGIASGSDGQIWFVEQNGNKVGHLPVTAASGAAIEEVVIPTAASGPWGITSGPDGALWFSEETGDKIGRIPTSATSSAQVTEIALGPGTNPAGIATSSDGNIWFAQVCSNVLGRMPVTATSSSQITEVLIPTAFAQPEWLGAGPSGSMLLPESNANKVATVPNGATTASQITEYALPSPSRQPLQMAVGPDGAIWFAEGNNNKIGRLANGTITEYPVPTSGATTAGLVTGPDGAIWFTENNEAKVGRLQ